MNPKHWMLNLHCCSLTTLYLQDSWRWENSHWSLIDRSKRKIPVFIAPKAVNKQICCVFVNSLQTFIFIRKLNLAVRAKPSKNLDKREAREWVIIQFLFPFSSFLGKKNSCETGTLQVCPNTYTLFLMWCWWSTAWSSVLRFLNFLRTLKSL